MWLYTLHNVLVTNRLNDSFNKPSDDDARLVQVPNHKILEPKFMEVPEIDDMNVNDLTSLFQTHMNLSQSHVPTSDRRERYVMEIYNQGYVRPKTTRFQCLSMQLEL